MSPIILSNHEDFEDDEFGLTENPTHLFCYPQVDKDELDEFGLEEVSPNIFCNQDSETLESENDNFDYAENDNTLKLFCSLPKNNTWMVDRDEMLSLSEVDLDDSIHIPMVIDTEFLNRKTTKKWKQTSREHLTTQIRGVHQSTPSVIFVTKDRKISTMMNAARERKKIEPFPKIQTPFHPIDYLKQCGIDVDLRPATKEECRDVPKCYITLYGHFLTAEINLICDGSIKSKFKELQRVKGNQPRIEMGRRIRAITPIDSIEVDYVELDHIIQIEGYDFSLIVRLIDTCAIHGIASYSAFCKSVGWKLQYKDNFTSSEKERMLDMAIERCIDYENYALGDLEVYEALSHYHDKFGLVYEKLGLIEYYREPKLTIGGTVKDLFEAALAKFLNIAPDEDSKWKKEFKEVVDEFIRPASASELRHHSTFTRAQLAKVEGGRCRNNRPIDISFHRKIKDGYDINLICDNDIFGCYGEGQRNQDYFLGIPEIWDYKATAKNNKYITLREWLKAYDVPVEAVIKGDWSNWGDLLSGAWIARVSTQSSLKYPQDFFASWFTESGHGVNIMAKFIGQMASDTELISNEWVDFNEEYGSLKIFNHEIHNALLQHDGLEWIFAVCSARQRNELLDKLIILTSAVYPKSQQVEPDLQKLKDIYNNWDGINTTERIVNSKGRKIIKMEFDECHAWFSINLGELLINNLLIERKKAQVEQGKKSPLDVLFKLCINTLYGDMVSKFFVTSNPITGNNITARARALAWVMEKGFHGFETITDGCALEINGVLFPGRDSINGESINLHREDSQLKRRKIRKGVLGNCSELSVDWSQSYLAFDKNNPEGKTIYYPTLLKDHERLTPIIIDNPDHPGFQILKSNPGIEWITTETMSHLQSIFSKLSILHKPTTALKVFKTDTGITHEFIDRVGQFSFEVKDIYHSGAFHGSANYLLENPNEQLIKARGYETKRHHEGIEAANENDEVRLFECDRYGLKNNPAKDLLNQILNNPSQVWRQIPGIKSAILKGGEYKNLADKYDSLNLEPGDNLLKVVLLQEFSISQFTFLTLDQYMSWKKVIDRGKLTDKQSLEAFFLNDDGSLDFKTMVETVDQMIAEGVMNPYEQLDPDRNRARADKRTKKGVGKGRHQASNIRRTHPQLEVYQTVKEQLAGFEESL